MTKSKTEYRITYPAQQGGDLLGERNRLTFNNKEEALWFIEYLRERVKEWEVEYREWTPTEWRTIENRD